MDYQAFHKKSTAKVLVRLLLIWLP
jgi:hypothetical protein